MGAPKTIIIKLRTWPSDAAAQASRIRDLVGRTAFAEAHPLFPDAGEGDLASLYEVNLKSSASLETILASLNQVAEVEYAHSPQERHPL